QALAQPGLMPRGRTAVRPPPLLVGLPAPPERTSGRTAVRPCKTLLKPATPQHRPASTTVGEPAAGPASRGRDAGAGRQAARRNGEQGGQPLPQIEASAARGGWRVCRRIAAQSYENSCLTERTPRRLRPLRRRSRPIRSRSRCFRTLFGRLL